MEVNSAFSSFDFKYSLLVESKTMAWIDSSENSEKKEEEPQLMMTRTPLKISTSMTM